MKFWLLWFLATLFIFGVAVLKADTIEALGPYIMKTHNERNPNSCIMTLYRAKTYADQIEISCQKYNVPLDIAVGILQWESEGFQNKIDKRGTGKLILPVRQWSFGLGQLKIATANYICKRVSDRKEFITGKELLCNYRLNIDLSIAYFAMCRDYKNGNIRKGLNAYRAGPVGEKYGNYMIKIRSNGKTERRQYADWVLDCSESWRRARSKWTERLLNAQYR